MVTMDVSPRNAWRSLSPGRKGWTRSARPEDPDKLFMISADCHAVEPAAYLAEYIEPEFRNRIPRMEIREDGSQWAITEGNRPMLVKPGTRTPTVQKQQSFERSEDNRHWTSRVEPEDERRNRTGRTMESRLADQAADGVDAELIFPNKGLFNWATPDPRFADAMCRA